MKNMKEDDDFLGRWLDNRLEVSELQAFKESEDYAAYEKIIQTLDELEAPAFENDRLFDQISQQINTQKLSQSKTPIRQIKKRYTFFYAAAGFLAFIGLTYLLVFQSSTKALWFDSNFTYTTATGEKHALTLPDGSSVKLNVFSKIQYQPTDWDKNRALEITGEAFFEVKKGQTFIVQTPEGKVEVLGTHFNVKQRASTLEVFCYSGEVKVKTSRFERILKAGEGLLSRNQAFKKIRRSAFAKSPGWLKGVTELYDTPLSEALEELRWHFGLSIVSDINLDQYEFTGDFPHEDVQLSIKLLLEPFEQLSYSYDTQSKTLNIRAKKNKLD